MFLSRLRKLILRQAFGQGFLEGYNTLDALASVAFSVIAVTTLNQLGFKNKKEYVSTIWVVGIVVALAFSAMYIGLAYLGNHFPVPSQVISKGNAGCLCPVAGDTGYLWTYSTDFPCSYGYCDLFYNNCGTYCINWGILP